MCTIVVFAEAQFPSAGVGLARFPAVGVGLAHLHKRPPPGRLTYWSKVGLAYCLPISRTGVYLYLSVYNSF